jgi:hypothetical protein
MRPLSLVLADRFVCLALVRCKVGRIPDRLRLAPMCSTFSIDNSSGRAIGASSRTIRLLTSSASRQTADSRASGWVVLRATCDMLIARPVCDFGISRMREVVNNEIAGLSRP